MTLRNISSSNLISAWASLVAQLVKNPPAIRETWVRSLGWEDPLEKGKATHSSILAWRIPWRTQMLFVFQFLRQKTRKYVIKARHAGLLKESILSNEIFKNPRRK